LEKGLEMDGGGGSPGKEEPGDIGIWTLRLKKQMSPRVVRIPHGTTGGNVQLPSIGV